MITIRQLARRFGLSRATLLYYDRIGLLNPVGRSEGGYRLYDDNSVETLGLIVTYKSSGLSLKAIKELLKDPEKLAGNILHQRVLELDKEIAKLRQQQQALVGMLRKAGGRSPLGSMDKKTWNGILEASGMSKQDGWRWHREFELSAPQAHHSFLRWLGISEEEAKDIRKRSRLSKDGEDDSAG